MSAGDKYSWIEFNSIEGHFQQKPSWHEIKKYIYIHLINECLSYYLAMHVSFKKNNYLVIYLFIFTSSETTYLSLLKYAGLLYKTI